MFTYSYTGVWKHRVLVLLVHGSFDIGWSYIINLVAWIPLVSKYNIRNLLPDFF